MKKKIAISSLAIVMILSMVIFAFAGCNNKVDYQLTQDFAVPEAYIGAEGNSLPTDAVVGGIKPVDDKMTAYEMFEIGIQNFYNANYAVIEYSGGVNMTLIGIKVNQVVQSTKIRQGIGDKDGNNANGATYFADNKSYSTFAKIYEKFVIRTDSFQRIAVASKKKGDSDNGTVKYNSSSKYGRLGAWSVDKWGNVADYQNLSELVTTNSNNPTILWMYELKEEYIMGDSVIMPAHDADAHIYKFAFEFDPEKSTVEYLKVMKVQLEGNAGMGVDGLQFNKLILEVVMWENGMIRAINVKESYQMKMDVPVLGYIDSVVGLKATQLFSYNPEEAGYKIQEHINSFNA